MRGSPAPSVVSGGAGGPGPPSFSPGRVFGLKCTAELAHTALLCVLCWLRNSCTFQERRRRRRRRERTRGMRVCRWVVCRVGALGEQGRGGWERRGRCVGLRVQRTGSLRHACFPLLPPSSKSLPVLLSLWTSSAGRRRHAHPFCAPVIFFSLSLSPGRVQSTKSIRLEASGDYPPNLSISLSGGKEINRDLPSSGERTGASPALNRGSAHAGREMWGEGLPAHPRGSGRAPHVEASARRPRTPHQRG